MNDSNKIQVKPVPEKVSFGYERYIPICRFAKIFALIADKKTLDRAHLNWIRELGFEIEIREAV